MTADPRARRPERAGVARLDGTETTAPNRGIPHPAAEARRAEYAELARLGHSKAYIAWKLSVSIRTVERYAAEQQGGGS